MDQRCFLLRRGQWWEAPGSFVPTRSYLKYTHKDKKITRIGFVPFPSGVLEQTVSEIDSAAFVIWHNPGKSPVVRGGKTSTRMEINGGFAHGNYVGVIYAVMCGTSCVPLNADWKMEKRIKYPQEAR